MPVKSIIEKIATSKRVFPLAKVYTLLETGPVVLITTSHKGTANVMTQSWHTVMEFEPLLLGCIVSNRNFSFKALKVTRQCVLNIPTVEMVAKVVGCGNESGENVNKFEKFALTTRPASMVAAPLIDDCYASLEWRVIDTRLMSRYNFFVLDIVKAWVDSASKDPRTLHHRGRGAFMIAGDTIKLPSKMK